MLSVHAVFWDLTGLYTPGWQAVHTEQGNASLGEAADAADHSAREQQNERACTVCNHVVMCMAL